MSQLHNKYHICDNGNIYKVNDDGSFTDMGNVEDIPQPNNTAKTNFHHNPKTITQFDDIIKFKANFLIEPFNSQGGYLYIFPDTFSFKPHRFYFGNLNEKKWEICQIIGYRKTGLTSLTIYLDCGEIEFAVWKKNSIITELESRRQAYYNDRGLSVPQLQVI